MIHDERECDKCVTEHNNLVLKGVQQMWQQMRLQEQQMLSQGCTNCALGHTM